MSKNLKKGSGRKTYKVKTKPVIVVKDPHKTSIVKVRSSSSGSIITIIIILLILFLIMSKKPNVLTTKN